MTTNRLCRRPPRPTGLGWPGFQRQSKKPKSFDDVGATTYEHMPIDSAAHLQACFVGSSTVQHGMSQTTRTISPQQQIACPPVRQSVSVPAGADARTLSLSRVLLTPWNSLGLPAKVSLMILVIVALSALSGEFLDRQYVFGLARESLQEEMTAVVRQIGAGITTRMEFWDQTARERELDRLIANRPDLIDVAVYGVVSGHQASALLLASAGRTMLPGLERAPPLVHRALLTSISTSSGHGDHRLQVAAPITVEGRQVGAAYAIFSTAQFDEVLDYQQRLSLTRRLLTGGVIVVVINF